MIRQISEIITALFVLSLFMCAQNGSTPTPALDRATAKVGVISIQAAIGATNDGAKLFQALNQKFEPKKKELQSLNADIERLKKQLATQDAVVNDQSRADLQRQIDAKQKTLAREQEDAQSDFTEQQNEIVQRVLQKLMPIVDGYAKQNGLGLVIDGSKPWPEWPVLWASSSLDITKAVVDIYNSQSGAAGSASGNSIRQGTPAKSPQPGTPKP